MLQKCPVSHSQVGPAFRKTSPRIDRILLTFYSLGFIAIPNVRYMCCSLGLAVSATYTGRSTLSCILNSLVALSVILVTANPRLFTDHKYAIYDV